MSDENTGEDVETLHQVVSIVSAYVSHNAMRAVELPEFISAVHASIRQLSKEQAATESKPPETPAVPVKRSVSKDFIVCLECGKKFKSLRRHLSSFHSLTPDEYRAKWTLPSDYPMVAPAYSATRSQLARESGLGQISRGGEAARADEDEMQDAAADEVAVDAAGDDSAAKGPAAAEADAAADDAPADRTESETAAEPAKKAKRGRPRKAAA